MCRSGQAILKAIWAAFDNQTLDRAQMKVNQRRKGLSYDL